MRRRSVFTSSNNHLLTGGQQQWKINPAEHVAEFQVQLTALLVLICINQFEPDISSSLLLPSLLAVLPPMHGAEFLWQPRMTLQVSPNLPWSPPDDPLKPEQQLPWTFLGQPSTMSSNEAAADSG